MSVGRRIVLYGHAVLLRHIPTDKVSHDSVVGVFACCCNIFTLEK